ncbi:hypothetical protein L1O03_03225 [Corynebacterium uropygiale]|uniref:Uncharacterized protein n=1 Tax=Corynebacterium uropygiale TaxID=1775911 RepID=A0A9X1QNH3_9CORY|nr:hypothetical protein [Corynebacterium uropygiale]MCF4006191.1 hypothetical protein [Corynebacterium uropygiale]
MTDALRSLSTLHLTRPRKRRREGLVLATPQGRTIARSEAQGSTARRLLMGNRRVHLVSEPDGDHLLTITDPVNVLRDSFEILSPEGTELARVISRHGWKGTSLHVTCAGEEELDVIGSLSDREFRLSSDEKDPTATWMSMSRQWSGVRAEMVDAASYVLSFREGLGEEERLLCVGVAIAVDLHQLKKESQLMTVVTTASGS